MRIKSLLFITGLFFTSYAGACPQGQKSVCLVPNPFGGCIQSGCVPDVSGPGIETREYNRIYVENSCNREIEVALAIPQINGHNRSAYGWWRLTPGEKAYLADDHFRDFWLFARSTDGQLTWQGQPCQWWSEPRGNGNLCYNAIDTGLDQYGDYTHNLTCN